MDMVFLTDMPVLITVLSDIIFSMLPSLDYTYHIEYNMVEIKYLLFATNLPYSMTCPSMDLFSSRVYG